MRMFVNIRDLVRGSPRSKSGLSCRLIVSVDNEYHELIIPCLLAVDNEAQSAYINVRVRCVVSLQRPEARSREA